MLTTLRRYQVDKHLCSINCQNMKLTSARLSFVVVSAMGVILMWYTCVSYQPNDGHMHVSTRHDDAVHRLCTCIPEKQINTSKTNTLLHQLNGTNAHLNTSKTKPPFYPLNGTGQTMNITADFDTSRFQEFCTMETDLEAVIPVYSAPDNFERRKAMRETVGRICSQMKCKMFFIVGVSLNKGIYNMVKTEYAAVNDILMVDKVDTYRDLNNKVVAMLDFLITFCKEPKYVIHIIDDFYPNLQTIYDQLNSIKETRFLAGCINKAAPVRQASHRWYVSRDEYPYDSYPPYIIGVVYAFLNNDSVVLRKTAHTVEYVWVEDSWFTGHVRIGADFRQIRFRKNYIRKAPTTFETLPSIWKSHTGMHKIIPSQFYEIYKWTSSLS